MNKYLFDDQKVFDRSKLGSQTIVLRDDLEAYLTALPRVGADRA
jgi:hypothetical protein